MYYICFLLLTYYLFFMKKTLIIAFLCCLCGSLWAQTRVTGRVVTEDGQPLPFVTISVKGTSTVSLSDDNGRYSITTPGSNSVLVFSFIGFITEEITVGTRSTIDIIMRTDAVAIDEVLVTAFGTSTRKSFTGSAAQISGEQIATRSITNAQQGLVGLTSGIQIMAATGEPGSSPTIRIRGVGSMNASNDPLYVVDGAPFGGSLNDIAVEDIATITVLKDAASSALYGSRAANGVIVITTKRGKASERSSVRVSIKQGFTDKGLPEQKMLGHKEWMELMWETYRNTLMDQNASLSLADANQRASGFVKNAQGTYTSGLISKIMYNPYNVGADQMVGTDGKLNPNAKLKWADDLDWFKAASQLGYWGEYTVSGTGGSDKTSYAASASYLKNQGYIIDSQFERLTARAAVDFKPTNWFKIGVTASPSLRTQDFANTSSSTGYANPFYFARRIGPIFPIHVHNQSTGEYLRDDAGELYWDWGGRTNLGSPVRPFSNGRHAIAENILNKDHQNTLAVNGNFYVEITPLKGLVLKATSSSNLRYIYSSSYDNNLVGDGAPAGRASRTTNVYTTWNNNQTASYTASFGKHDFSILAGHESYSYERNYFYGFRQSQVMEGNSELVNFTTTNSLTSYTQNSAIESYLSNLNYSFGNKFNASLSFRRDGSSRFYKENRWGNFWAVGAAYRLESEPFMQSIKWVNLLKLRASYGTVGNDEVGLYPYMALYSISYANANEAGSYQTALANLKLQWEVQKTLDFAVEFMLWRKLSGSIEYFDKRSSNLLYDVPLPLSSGAATPGSTSATITQNIGTMYNKGFEFQLEYDAVKTRDINWRLTLNATALKNGITNMPDHLKADGIVQSPYRRMEGHSFYSFWLREWMGVNPDNGLSRYRLDTKTQVYNPNNAEHSIVGKDTLTTNVNAARYYWAGQSFPKVYGSLGNNFRYKKWSLDFVFIWSLGGKMIDGTYQDGMSNSTTIYGESRHVDLLNRWQKPGDVTKVPKLTEANTNNQNAGSSDRWLVSSSYINLNTITLSYQLPVTFNGNRVFSSASVYLTATNLFQVSARYGMNAAQNMGGTTSNVYSPNRTISLGLNFNL